MATKSPTTRSSHQRIEDFSGGLVTLFEANKLDLNQSPFSQNNTFEGRNSIAKRRGTILNFDDDSVAVGIGLDGVFTFRQNDGSQSQCVIYDGKFGYMDKTLVPNTFIEIATGIASNTTFGFEVFDDTLYFMSDAVNTLYEWGGPSGSFVAHTNRVDVAAGAVQGNILSVKDRKLFVASSTTSKVWRSFTDDPTDFANVTGGNSEDAGITNFKEGSGPITSIQQLDKMLIFKESGIFTLDYDPTLDVYLAPTVRRQQGAINHFGTHVIENEIFYFDPGLLKIKSIGYASNWDGFKSTTASDLIRPTVQALKFDLARTVFYKDQLFMACRTADALVNNRVLVYDFLYKAWKPYTNWSVGFWDIHEGDLYYGSSNDTSLYQVEANVFSDNGAGIPWIYDTPAFDWDTPETFKTNRWIYIEGFMSLGDEITVEIYYDDNDSPITKVINLLTASINTSSTLTWGGDEWAGTPWGGDPSSSGGFVTNRFTAWLNLRETNYQRIQLRLLNSSSSPLKVERVVPYVKYKDEKVIPKTHKV